MPVFVSTLLISVAAVWLMLHQIVWRKLRGLEAQLPAAYQRAVFAKPEDKTAPLLILLAIDLIRKQHSTPPFETLTEAERRVALYAYGVEVLPRWMTRQMMFGLRGAEKALVAQLRQIKTSRPVRNEMHFGAIQAQLRLRSTSER